MASLREVGQALREAREAQGRTQEQIADITRISLRHVKAIEEGNEAELPEVFYVRSFLKKYADAVGLSANEVADAYRSAPVPTTQQPSLGMAVGPIVYYLAIALVFVGLLALAWHFQPKVKVISEPSPLPTTSAKPSPKPSVPAYGPQPLKPSPKPTAKPSPAPSGSVAPTSPAPTLSPAPAVVASPAASVAPSPVAPSPSPTQAASPSPAPTPSPSASPAPKGAKVDVVIQERSWVEIRANGRAVFEGTMQAGTKKSVSGSDVEVTAGNAGGVRVFVNGQDRGVLGGRGEVVTKTFNP